MEFSSTGVSGWGANPPSLVTVVPLWLGERAAMESPSAVPAAVLDALPSCAVDCVTATCPLSDITCICTIDSKAEDERTSCMIDSCGLPQSLSARNLTATACNAPIRDRSVEFNVMTVSLLGVTVVTVFMRLVFKQFFSIRRRLSIDDWFIVLSSLVGIPCIAILIFGLNTHGLGKDVWTLPPADVTTFALYFYIMEILYLTVISLVRVTLSLFYLEIFPGQRIRRLLWGTIAFHVAFGFAFVIKVVFQCTPIHYNWDKYNDTTNSHGHCIAINASSWANAAIGVAADFWLLAIPLSQLQKLNLYWKKKVGAAFMFMTGAVGTLISILRLHSISHFANSTNPTWEQFSIVWWSDIEVQVGMICTCLPAIRLILVRISPRIFGNGSQHSNTGSDRSNEPRTGHSSADVEMGEGSYTSTSRICKSSTTKVYQSPATGKTQEKVSDEYSVEVWSGGDREQQTLPIELGERKHEERE